MAMVKPLKVTLGEPVVVSRAPVGLKRWGPWQFPSVERLGDGRLHLSFHVEADSATAYGLPAQHAVSSDGGATWTAVGEVDGAGGLLLPNGDRLQSKALRSLKAEGLPLPEPVERRPLYAVYWDVYRREDLSPELQDGWHLLRLRSGDTSWVEERATVNLPGEVRHVTEGVLVFPWFMLTRLAPDGSLWGIHYGLRMADGVVRSKGSAMFLRSVDSGHTWSLHGEIPYNPDPSADPQADLRWGFTEPDIAFMPDGSVFCLLRTTDGHGVGPMYWSRSQDNGGTWSHPQVFDDRGVWPQMLTLKSGVTVMGYGRPGLFVRASADPSGIAWGERVTVVPPIEVARDSCSYCALIDLDERTALIVYSDFNYPDEEGQKRKTILTRTVTVE